MVHDTLSKFYLLQENLTFLILIFSSSTLYVLLFHMKSLNGNTNCLLVYPLSIMKLRVLSLCINNSFFQLNFNMICCVLPAQIFYLFDGRAQLFTCIRMCCGNMKSSCWALPEIEVGRSVCHARKQREARMFFAQPSMKSHFLLQMWPDHRIPLILIRYIT